MEHARLTAWPHCPNSLTIVPFCCLIQERRFSASFNFSTFFRLFHGCSGTVPWDLRVHILCNSQVSEHSHVCVCFCVKMPLSDKRITHIHSMIEGGGMEDKEKGEHQGQRERREMMGRRKDRSKTDCSRTCGFLSFQSLLYLS